MTSRRCVVEIRGTPLGSDRSSYIAPVVAPLANGRLVSDTATAYALGLSLGFVEDPEIRDRMGAQPQRAVRDHLYSISTGFFDTAFVLSALFSMGRDRDTQRLLEHPEQSRLAI